MALISLEHFSSALNMNMNIRVILPENRGDMGAGGADSGSGELPVLYLLHGTTDDQTVWLRRTSLERYAADKELAVVMPCGHLSAYTNQEFGMRYYDYVAHEVPELCRKYFRVSVKREDNYIGGLSMGGYGALKIGFKESGRFGKIAALSPGCDRTSLLPELAFGIGSVEELVKRREEFVPEEYRKTMAFFVNFGSVKAYRESVSDNLFNLIPDCVEKRKTIPEIFMCCGIEDFLLAPVRELREVLTKLGVRHKYYESAGRHDWEYWDANIQKALDWLIR